MPVATVTAEAAPEPDYETALEGTLTAGMTAVGEVLVESVLTSFETQTAPDGTAWDVTPETAREKARLGQTQILVRSGTLWQSVHYDPARIAETRGREVAVRAGGAAGAYASVQQARDKYLPITDDGSVQLPAPVAEEVRETLRDAVLLGLRRAKSEASTR